MAAIGVLILACRVIRSVVKVGVETGGIYPEGLGIIVLRAF